MLATNGYFTSRMTWIVLFFISFSTSAPYKFEVLSCVYICGGGAHNTYLLQRLQQMLDPVKVASTKELGFDPEWVEAENDET